MSFAVPPGRRACENWRKRTGLLTALSLALALSLSGTLAAQDAHGPSPTPAAPAGHAPAAQATHGAPAGGAADQADHAETEGHETSPWGLIGKIVNFALLVGTLVYFLRTPFATYLRDRSEQIRTDLVTAERMKVEAGQQIADIEAKLRELPGELELLKTRGRAEIEAEEQRIRAAAETDRDRLLEQTRRAIDLQVRSAKRDLVTHAADLAVGVAHERIRRQITDEDQRRLVDRYLAGVRSNG